jgi:tetratricopeptide (TPR) repeat protein
MNKIKFWKNWDTNIRYPYLFLLQLGVLALLLGVYHYFTGSDLAFGWDKTTDLQVVPVPVHEVMRLLEPFTLSADGYLLFEQYDVAQPTINTVAASLMLGILAICLAFYTAAMSTMRQMAYFGGVLLLMLFLATFNFDALDASGGGASQTLLLVSIALLSLSSYAFQTFWPQVTFSLRLLAMLVVMVIIGMMVFGSADFPGELVTLHLVSYSSIGALVATVLFMLWVAYENVNALLWINTQAKTPERRFSMWHFILISVLYLLNLLLLYLRHVGYLQLDLFYINAYIIFLLSTVAGFWGMRQREAYYKKLFLFRPTGAVLYMVFATIAFLSIGYAFATANDPLTVFYHDIIVYTHLAFGIGFFLYVMINFGRLIDQRLPVYKVVYEPKSFSLFSFYLMSLIVCAILVMRTQYRSYFDIKAGYYNYLGDLYTASGNGILAERFYKESDLYDANNVKANYSLAAMYRQQEQRNNEILSLKDALQKRPNPKLYVRLANLYDEKQFFFEKLYVLQEGAEKFPESGEIYNNLALLYSQTSVQDSTEYYFSLAQEHNADADFVRSNRLAFYTRQAMLEPAKVVLEDSRKGKNKALQSNIATLRQLLGMDPQEEDDFMPDSLQAVEDFTLFYNQTISRLNRGDTARLAAIENYLATPGNRLFHEDLLYLKGLVHHYNGLPKEGRNILENLALQSERRSGYYYNALGQWMLEEQNYRAAAAYFKQAKDHGYNQAFLSHGYALALAHQPDTALEALEEVAYTDNEAAVDVAQDLAEVLQQDVKTITTVVPDKEKVQYLLAHLPRLSLQEVDALVQAVEEKDLKRRALVARVEYLVGKKSWRAAYDAIKEASPQLQPEGELRSALNLQQLKVWLYTENYDALHNRMGKLHLTDRDKRQRLYFKARIAEARGRAEEAATSYEQALKMLLYDEEVVLAAANFFDKYKPDQEVAYNILLSGITYNPYSAQLYKAYALESLDQGLYSYAEQAQETLRNLLPASEYATFIKKLDQKRQEIDNRADNWQL